MNLQERLNQMEDTGRKYGYPLNGSRETIDKLRLATTTTR